MKILRQFCSVTFVILSALVLSEGIVMVALRFLLNADQAWTIVAALVVLPLCSLIAASAYCLKRPILHAGLWIFVGSGLLFGAGTLS